MVEKTKTQVKEKFSQEDYPIHIIGRHVEVTEAMKNYAIEKLKKIDRFNCRIQNAFITMDIQRVYHCVDFVLDINNVKIKVSGRTDNMYASIDQAISHLETKLRKYLEKIHAHHSKSRNVVDMNVNIINRLDEINDQIEEENLKTAEASMRPHQVTSRETKTLKTLTLEEAIMKMELSEDPFMIYRSEEDRQLKVIYVRGDGNYGIIEPEA